MVTLNEILNNGNTIKSFFTELYLIRCHFKVFEALLEQPDLLGVQSQIECPVNDVTQRHKLIALYYGFDSRVLREFMGLKLTAKLRSNLDDISDRTHVPIRSVRRQFDNLRRVHARFDEVSVFRGNNTQHISEEFCLPTPLARRYAAASFLLFKVKLNAQSTM